MFKNKGFRSKLSTNIDSFLDTKTRCFFLGSIIIFTCITLVSLGSFRKLLNDNQGVLGFLAIILAVLGFWYWKNIHRKERASNVCTDLISRILDLQFSILEQRQPKFLPFQKGDETGEKEYIENKIAPYIMEVGKKASIIQKEISIFEDINLKSKILTGEFNKKILREVIYELHFAISLYNMDAGKEELYSLIFPLENKEIRKKHIKGELSKNDIGQILIGDDFEAKIISNFNFIITRLKKHVI